ncbi:MAG: hypothetical protein R3202_08895, partial [Candidatus Competibacterales bacterium]|nr:hypothetical protein [Candidatus Competibacterales bacterium]
MRNENFPDPGSAEELERFARLQRSLSPMFERLLGDPGAPRTVIVAPSLSLDARELAKIAAVHHYEERLLCLLLQLHHPRTHLIFITSQPLDPAIVDYYLHLLPGIPTIHARRRLTLLDCHDASLIPLTRKILERPRLMQRIRDAIHDPDSAHLVCFSPSILERTLAVRLNVPLYACDPAMSHLGRKSGCRTLFREAGVPLPDGFEQLRDTDDLVQGLTELKQRHPDLGQAVVKLDEGFSGEGNALFNYDGLAADAGLERRIREELPRRLGFTAYQETWDDYRSKLEQMGGIVECFVDGAENRSPSVQCRIDPRGRIELISTHE